MSRIIPPCPPEPEMKESLSSPETETRTYTIAVITPLFGGGTKPGVNDPITLIRPSSIRGHLRFWWRATRGAKCQTVEELRQREGEIWGTAKNPSPVTIRVGVPQWSQQREPKDSYGFPRYGAEAYALFPAQQNGNVLCKEGLAFSLTVRWLTNAKLQALRQKENAQRHRAKKPLLPEKIQDISLDIEAAVWAWVNFGGIGARTRRGCGALYCQDFAPPTVSNVADWLTNARKKYELPEKPQPRPWSTFGAIYLALKNPLSALTAWNEAIRTLQEFRQGIGIGRKTGPGRSYWPEADSLRAITGRSDSEHASSTTLRNLRNNPAFPRAALGLPIVFHFKDPADSPNNSELYPKGQTRMASPIILRPLALNVGGQAVALIVQLTTLRLEALVLKKLLTNPELTASHISRPELANYDKSPLKRSPHGSALEAFIAFAKEKGFQECKP